MKRKFKKALKEAYHIPEPERRELFLRNAELHYPPAAKPHKIKMPQIHPAAVRSMAAVVTAATFFSVYTFYKDVPTVPPEMIVDQIQPTTEPPSEPQADETTAYAPETTQTTASSAQTSSESVDEASDQIEQTTCTTAVSYETFPEKTVETGTTGVASTAGTTVPPQSVSRSTTTQPKSITGNAVQTQRTTKNTVQTKQTTGTARTTHTTAKTTPAKTTTATPAKTTSEEMNDIILTTTTEIQLPPGPTTTASPTDDNNLGFETTTFTTDLSVSDPERNDTVTPLYQYDVTDKIYDNSDSYENAVNNATWQQMADASDLIVSGIIEAVYFTSIDGSPWTQIDIYIVNNYSGERNSGDRISIYVPGGYMPLAAYISQNSLEGDFSDMTQEEIDEITLFDSRGSAAVPATYEWGIFFLSNGLSAVPDGAYQYTFTTDICRFTENSMDSNLVNRDFVYVSIGDSSCSFLEDDLWAYLMQ